MRESHATSPTWRERTLAGAFELLYHNRALYWLASTIPFAGQWRTWQRRALSRIHGTDVLEIGCGLGTLLTDVQAAGFRCVAVDASPQMVAAARARLKRRGHLHPEDVVSLARVQQLPFADASFDTVISTFPTPYIYDVSAIAEIARVLRPGGRLVVVEGASLLPANPLLRPFVLFQSAVYGHSVPRSVREADQIAPGATCDVRTETLPQPRSAIPLERAGLSRREETDIAQWWVVFVVIGEKPEARSTPASRVPPA